MKICFVHFPTRDEVLKHVLGRQPAHLDQPFDGFAGSFENESSFGIDSERHDAEVDIWGEPLVQAYLVLAVAAPRCQGAEVQKIITHGFL